MANPTFEQVRKHTENLGGEVLYFYDQGLDHRARAGGGITDNGWCAAMAAFWIQKYAKGESFWAWMGADKKAAPGFSDAEYSSLTPVNPLRRVMLLQEAVKVKYKDQVSERVKLDYWAPIVEATTSFKRNRSRDMQLGRARGSATDIAGRLGGIIANGPGFRHIVFVWKGRKVGDPDPAHAVAAHIDATGVVRYMDPNYGEFKLPDKATFATWLKKFFVTSDYKTTYILRSSACTRQ